ncbi:hypothetical protein BaRGS_00004239, partial [Batillaria attramentaria]
MTSLTILSSILILVVLIRAEDPSTPTCTRFPRQWEITAIDMRTLNKPQIEYSKMAWDLTQNKQAILTYTRDLATGELETAFKERTVNDFEKHGKCTSSRLTAESPTEKIPDDAFGLFGSDYMGTDLFFDMKTFTTMENDEPTQSTFAFTATDTGECVPLFR